MGVAKRPVSPPFEPSGGDKHGVMTVGGVLHVRHKWLLAKEGFAGRQATQAGVRRKIRVVQPLCRGCCRQRTALVRPVAVVRGIAYERWQLPGWLTGQEDGLKHVC